MKRIVACLAFSVFGSYSVQAADLDVSYKWCNPSFRTTSPSIEFKNIPKEAAKLEITIVDHYNGKYHLNVTIDNKNQKKIDCGELNAQWNGLMYPPGHCAGGVPHTYELTVKALDKSGSSIGKKAFSRGCPE